MGDKLGRKTDKAKEGHGGSGPGQRDLPTVFRYQYSRFSSLEIRMEDSRYPLHHSPPARPQVFSLTSRLPSSPATVPSVKTPCVLSPARWFLSQTAHGIYCHEPVPTADSISNTTMFYWFFCHLANSG